MKIKTTSKKHKKNFKERMIFLQKKTKKNKTKIKPTKQIKPNKK